MKLLLILCVLYSCSEKPILYSKCVDGKVYYCYTSQDYCQTYTDDTKICTPTQELK